MNHVDRVVVSLQWQMFTDKYYIENTWYDHKTCPYKIIDLTFLFSVYRKISNDDKELHKILPILLLILHFNPFKFNDNFMT